MIKPCVPEAGETQDLRSKVIVNRKMVKVRGNLIRCHWITDNSVAQPCFLVWETDLVVCDVKSCGHTCLLHLND